MFVSEQLLYTKETKKDTDAYNKTLLFAFRPLFCVFWCDYDLSYHVCTKSRRQWTLNIHFHKLGFYLPTHDTTHDSNMFIDGSLFPV